MAKVPNGEETLPKISTGWVRRTNVADKQTDDRRTGDNDAVMLCGWEGNRRPGEKYWQPTTGWVTDCLYTGISSEPNDR